MYKSEVILQYPYCITCIWLLGKHFQIPISIFLASIQITTLIVLMGSALIFKEPLLSL